MFADKVIQEQLIRQSDPDWIIVRPAKLTDGFRTGKYQAGVPLSMGLFASISRADVADFLLKQIGDDTYLHKVPRVRYPYMLPENACGEVIKWGKVYGREKRRKEEMTAAITLPR